MPTFSPVCLRHHRRADGSYPVKIRISHKRKSRWLPTTLTAQGWQLTRDLRLKDLTLKARAAELIVEMQRAISKLSYFALDAMDIGDVVDYLKRELGRERWRCDFIEYGRKVAAGKSPGTGKSYTTAINSFSAFVGGSIDVNEITTALLREYAEGVNPMYLARLSAIYSAAKNEYNDEDSGVIRMPRDPFARVRPAPVIHEGAKALPHDVMQMLIDEGDDCPERFALDLFLVSFALMGANLADLFLASPPEGDVWEYERAKTRGRRADKARMRVVVPPEVSRPLERLKIGAKPGRWLALGASRESVTIRANRGLKAWAVRRGLEGFTFYAARKTFATTARQAGVEKATIDECLAHIGDYKVADIYIERSWPLLWDAQRKVLEQFTWPFTLAGD